MLIIKVDIMFCLLPISQFLSCSKFQVVDANVDTMLTALPYKYNHVILFSRRSEESVS